MMGSALTRAKRPMTVEAFRDRPAVSSHSSCALSHSSCAINPIVPELSCTSPLGACEKCLLYQAQRVDRRRNSGIFCRWRRNSGTIRSLSMGLDHRLRLGSAHQLWDLTTTRGPGRAAVHHGPSAFVAPPLWVAATLTRSDDSLIVFHLIIRGEGFGKQERVGDEGSLPRDCRCRCRCGLCGL